MFSLQVSNADLYIAQAQGISYRKAVIKAQRGEILDCNGREIAVNREGYNIVFNKAYFDEKNSNDLILRLCKLLKSKETEWSDTLPLEKEAPFNFTDNLGAVASLRSHLGLAHYATAEHCFAEMVERYELKSYDDNTKRIIMGVRYTLEAYDFSVSNPFTFAVDVSSEIMQMVLEAKVILNGVTINVVPFREYVNGTLAPHLIGRVGPIQAENWDKYKGKGYSFDDIVGVDGIEAVAEEDLHGTDGEITYEIDSKGNILSSKITKQPIPGKTVVLNLNKSIQLATQEALATTINELKAKESDVSGGAAVMIDVRTGGVIASANFPSYDLADYSKNFNALISDPNTPLNDRAFQGIYPPGSTVKPAIAVAAMENNKLTADEHIFCATTYYKFPDYTPSCMGYHRSINLKTALSKSCNYFFFEMGYRLGLNNINKYFKLFGLGTKTGVDFHDSSGLLNEDTTAGLGGNTLQAAIGQMNAFTPLQLAVYVSTMANEGVRYKPALIDRVVSYDMSETYYQATPEIEEQFTITTSVIKAVKEGMLSVTEDGTGSLIFKNYPIKVGGKTGTSQVTDKADHSVFVGFAPYDKPEIAIAIVIEHGRKNSAAVAKPMLDAYFFANEITVDKTKPNLIIP